MWILGKKNIGSVDLDEELVHRTSWPVQIILAYQQISYRELIRTEEPRYEIQQSRIRNINKPLRIAKTINLSSSNAGNLSKEQFSRSSEIK